ncbi:MAG: hypothetical protein WCV55_03015 [Candidatus Paceibacterota bacterium]
MKKEIVELDEVPLGTFVKGIPVDQTREEYEHDVLVCQIVYQNTAIDIVVLLFADGNLDYFTPRNFFGYAVNKPRYWPKKLDTWKQRKREFHIKAFDSRSLRPFDYNEEKDKELLRV